jgi:hypothetical protein
MPDCKSRSFGKDKRVFVKTNGKEVMIFEFLNVINQELVWLLYKYNICIVLFESFFKLV